MQNLREEGPAILPDSGQVSLPDPPDEEATRASSSAHSRSLLDDLEDLVLDAKTYFDAELSYQKSRASFVSSCVKNVVALGAAAALLGIVALIALAVGLIIALTPLITAWGATAVVVGLLLLGVFLLLRRISAIWSDAMTAVREEGPADGE